MRSASAIEKLSGRYVGEGRWYDAIGQSQAYTIEQQNLATPDGIELAFKHRFEDGSVVDATFVMIEIAPSIHRLEVSGAAVGNGYILGDTCHYHLKVGEAFVEASYRITDEGLLVFGSSSKNADGNYIGWHETLRRLDQEAASCATSDKDAHV
jgi:hypothetical protein